MGAIRGILIVLVSLFLFISLLVGNLFLTMNLSLSYENVNSGLGDFADNIIGEQDLKTIVDTNIIAMQIYCQSNSEFVFKDESSGYTFSLPCSVASQGSDAIFDYLKSSFVKQIYYAEYDCGFVDCLEKTGSPLFLISEKAKNYFGNKFYLSLLCSLSLVAFMFFLTEKKSNTFIIAGSLLIFAGLPFIKLDWALSFIPEESLLGLLTIFFSESYNVFLLSLIFGIVFVVIGILFKIFNIGLKISGFFSKFSKKQEFLPKETKPVVKKEIPKVEPKKNLPKPKTLLSKKKKSK